MSWFLLLQAPDRWKDDLVTSQCVRWNVRFLSMETIMCWRHEKNIIQKHNSWMFSLSWTCFKDTIFNDNLNITGARMRWKVTKPVICMIYIDMDSAFSVYSYLSNLSHLSIWYHIFFYYTIILGLDKNFFYTNVLYFWLELSTPFWKEIMISTVGKP